MIQLAHIIDRYGAAYIPLYVRMEAELEILKQRENELARTRAFSEANAHRFPELNLIIRRENS
ncbi:hypothetical protein [Tardiphaga sp.]|jgi:hypothetical protein|uniref:hypothetical protein n=1 Tax=Tardiphaga sp. TaxID=1926292 RepID=UPI0037DA6B5A